MFRLNCISAVNRFNIFTIATGELVLTNLILNNLICIIVIVIKAVGYPVTLNNASDYLANGLYTGTEDIFIFAVLVCSAH